MVRDGEGLVVLGDLTLVACRLAIIPEDILGGALDAIGHLRVAGIPVQGTARWLGVFQQLSVVGEEGALECDGDGSFYMWALVIGINGGVTVLTAGACYNRQSSKEES